MGMMWDRMGQELSGMIESVFGGHAYVNPRANTVDYTGPKNGVGGMVGGAVRAGTLRIVRLPTPSPRCAEMQKSPTPPRERSTDVRPLQTQLGLSVARTTVRPLD